MTYSLFQANLFADELESSQDQPLVSRLAKPENEQVQTMSGISFQSFFEWWQICRERESLDRLESRIAQGAIPHINVRAFANQAVSKRAGSK